MMRIFGALIAFFAVVETAAAEWVRIGENNRSIAYADTMMRRTGDTVVIWVLFDYKTVQQSPTSGRKYLSEKAQREINCRAERERVLFFTWHSERMGDGVVVYTGRKATEWEPTSAPQSYGSLFSEFACRRR